MLTNFAKRRFPALMILGAAAGWGIGGLLSPAGTEERLRSAECGLWQRQEQRGASEDLKAQTETWKQLSISQDGDARQRSRACKGYGDCLYLSGEYGAAVEAYREALRWDSGNEGARLNLCLAMDRLPPPPAEPPAPSSLPAAAPPQADPPGGGASPRPSEPPQADKAPPAPDDRLLRRVTERERDRRRHERRKREKLPPPRGTETW